MCVAGGRGGNGPGWGGVSALSGRAASGLLGGGAADSAARDGNATGQVLCSATIAALRICFRMLYKEGRTQTGALELISNDLGHVPEVVEFVQFIRASKIGISPARDPGRNRRSV